MYILSFTYPFLPCLPLLPYSPFVPPVYANVALQPGHKKWPSKDCLCMHSIFVTFSVKLYCTLLALHVCMGCYKLYTNLPVATLVFNSTIPGGLRLVARCTSAPGDTKGDTTTTKLPVNILLTRTETVRKIPSVLLYPPKLGNICTCTVCTRPPFCGLVARLHVTPVLEIVSDHTELN